MDVLFKIESKEIFTQVLEDILDNLFDLKHSLINNEIDPRSLATVKEEIKELILKPKLNIAEVTSVLSAQYINDIDKVKSFVSLFQEKKTRLLYLSLIHYNCKYGETLDTFDWKLKLVCGTSELKTLSYSLLQLAFNTVTVNHKSAVRLYEVNKDMIMMLIGTLEEIIGGNTMQ